MSLMKAAITQTTSNMGGAAGVAGMVVALAPVIHRLTAMIRQLQPEVEGWIRAERERAETQLKNASTQDQLVLVVLELRSAQQDIQATLAAIEEKMST